RRRRRAEVTAPFYPHEKRPRRRVEVAAKSPTAFPPAAAFTARVSLRNRRLINTRFATQQVERLFYIASIHTACGSFINVPERRYEMSHDECRLIRLPQVLERVGLSRSAIYAMIK